MVLLLDLVWLTRQKGLQPQGSWNVRLLLGFAQAYCRAPVGGDFE